MVHVGINALIPLVLAAAVGLVYGDYSCLCNTHVERGVYQQPTETVQPFTYLYEFDCKPIVQQTGTLPRDWAAVAFEGKLGYVLMDVDVVQQTCAGHIADSDKIKSTVPPFTAVQATTSSVHQTSSIIPTSSAGPLPSSSSVSRIHPSSSLISTSSRQPAVYVMKTSSMHPSMSVMPTSSMHPTTYVNPTSSIQPATSVMPSASIQPTRSVMPSTSIQQTVSVMPSSSIQPTRYIMPTTSMQPSSSITTSSIHPSRPGIPSSSTVAQTTTTMSITSNQPSTIPTTSAQLLSTSVLTTSTVYTTASTVRTSPTSSSQRPSVVISGNMDYCSPNLHIYTHHDRGYLAQYGNSCYELVPTRHSWPNAENNCRQKGGHLFHISNAEEEMFIYAMLRDHFGNHTVWTGLHDRTNEEHFQWTSGVPVNYTHWKPGRKDNFFYHTSEDCVVFVPYIHHGDWDDIPCGDSVLDTTAYPYICQFATVVPVVPSVTTAGPSPQSIPGNTGLCSSTLHYYAQRDRGTLGQFDRSCYEFVHQRYNWLHAEQLCRGRGGFLAHIQNFEQQTFIQAFMMKYNSDHAVWIGLHDRAHEEQFEWTSGNPVTYTNWISGRKSNYMSHNSEDCVAMIPYKQGLWDDIPCGASGIFSDLGETHYVLCQYENSHIPPNESTDMMDGLMNKTLGSTVVAPFVGK